MAEATVTQANNVSPDLVAARTACADAIVRGYGESKKYAKALRDEFGPDWADEESPAVKEEKTAFYALLKAGNHSNPSVAWARIKKESAKIDAAAQAEHDAERGEPTEGSGNARHTRTPQARYVQELSELYRFGKREMEKLNDKQRRVHTLIAAALAELGTDIALL